MSYELSPNVIISNTSIGKLRNHLWVKQNALMTTDRKSYPEIGARLAAIRSGFSDLPQSGWAEKHGFSQTQYHQWEKGTRRIPIESAEKLCALYGITLDAIYRGRLDGLSENARKVFCSTLPIAETTWSNVSPVSSAISIMRSSRLSIAFSI